MKTKVASLCMQAAFLAVLVVLGVHSAAHANPQSDTVTFNVDGNQNVTCTTVLHPGSCFDYIANTSPAGSQTLDWWSTTMVPNTTTWLTITPGPIQKIAPGASIPITYSLNNPPTTPGSYQVTITLVGQTETPGGNFNIPNSTVVINLNVAALNPPGNPGGCTGSCGGITEVNTGGDASVACGTIKLTWAAGTNADSYNINRNGSPLVTHVAGLTYTDNTPALGTSYTYSVQSYSATRGVSAFVNFTPSPIQATPCGTTGPPTSPTDQNTAGSSSVACNTVQLNWAAGTHDDSYDIYRNGTPLLTHYVGLSYTDATAASGTTYTYTIDGYSAIYGTSAIVPFAPGSIQSSPCQVNLSISDELISSVNNKLYPYSSGCVGTQAGVATPIEEHESVMLQVDICNTGTTAAQNVIVTSVFNENSPYNTYYYCCITGETQPPTSYVNNGGGVYTLTWYIGTVAANSHATIYNAMTPAMLAAPTQNLQRFINNSSITYTSVGGHVAPAGCVGNYADASTPCVVSTGYIPFSTTATSGTTQQEVQP